MEQGTLQRRARVAAYCRVAPSSGDQSFALAAQEAHYRQMIGENPDWELAGIFADEGIAGRGDRGGFDRMMAACKRGRVDLILTKSMSRFARNTVDCLKVIRELKTRGIGVIFEKENVDTLALSDSDELRMAVCSELARAESEELEKRFGRHICIMYMNRTTG